MALKVTQTGSSIGEKPATRGTLRALGLRGPGQTNTLPDRKEIRGMLNRAGHLVRVEQVADAELAAKPAKKSTLRKKDV
jgi:large subunit ribosomal protein L30